MIDENNHEDGDSVFHTLKEPLSILLVTISAILLIWLIRYVSGVLTPLLVAFVIAITLRPLFFVVKRSCDHYYHRAVMTRTRVIFGIHVTVLTSIASLLRDITYFGITLSIPFGIGYWIYTAVHSSVSDQLISYTANFIAEFDFAREYLITYLDGLGLASGDVLDYVSKLRDEGQSAIWIDVAKSAIVELSPAILAKVSGAFTGVVGALGSGAFTLIVTVATWIILPQFMFYMMSNKLTQENLERAFGLFKTKGYDTNRKFAQQFIIFRDVLELYFQKQTIAVLIYTAIFFAVLLPGSGWTNYQYSLGLAVAFGVLNYFPNLGSIAFLVFSVVMVLLGGLSVFALVGVFLGVLLAYCIDEFFLLRLTYFELLYQHKVHSGIMIFFILFWGAALNGLLGMLLAVPLTLYFGIEADRRKHSPPAIQS